MKRLIDENNPPKLEDYMGSVHSFERGLDPWHTDAFPNEFKHAAISKGRRKGGWFALDAWGNAIGFIPDRSD